MVTKAPCWPALAGLFLMIPTAACGQTQRQPQQKNTQSSRPRSGLTLHDFTIRREQRVLAADSDGDGKVSRAEFLASATSGKGDPARRFGRFDRNGDGMIDPPEIAAMMARRFRRLDADSDGVLTPTERTAARATMKQGDPGS